jgi:hypothetical protein
VEVAKESRAQMVCHLSYIKVVGVVLDLLVENQAVKLLVD